MKLRCYECVNCFAVSCARRNAAALRRSAISEDVYPTMITLTPPDHPHLANQHPPEAATTKYDVVATVATLRVPTIYTRYLYHGRLSNISLAPRSKAGIASTRAISKYVLDLSLVSKRRYCHPARCTRR